MNRRKFISQSTTVLAAHSLFAGRGAEAAGSLSTSQLPVTGRPTPSPHLYRFGVNYTPSTKWWFCWNDWDPSPIRRDLDAISALGADHMRILLIWPYFQPNPKFVSSIHLDRLEQLLLLMEERHLDAVVTVFTGQLSGWRFLPPFNLPGPAFYTDEAMWASQELFVRELARRMNPHSNFIGFDLGNELNTCWRTEPPVGDAWMQRMFSLMESVSPGSLHVNGVDHAPWLGTNTFSPRALAARPFPVVHCYPFWADALKYGGPMDPPSTMLLSSMAALIRSYAGDPQKPVWVEEFNTCIESLDTKKQAEWLEKAVTDAAASGVSWFTYWDSHDVDRSFTFASMEYSLGLLTNDGRVKDQGRVFKRLADSYRGKPVVFPTTPLPPPPSKSEKDISWKWLLDYMEWKPRA